MLCAKHIFPTLLLCLYMVTHYLYVYYYTLEKSTTSWTISYCITGTHGSLGFFPHTQNPKIQHSFQFRLCLDQLSHILLSLPITTNISLNSKLLFSGPWMKIRCWFPPVLYILYLPYSKLEDTEFRIWPEIHNLKNLALLHRVYVFEWEDAQGQSPQSHGGFEGLWWTKPRAHQPTWFVIK